MTGIARWSVEDLHTNIRRFDKKYVRDWEEWLSTTEGERPRVLGLILRRWQACRPNRMRRTAREANHPGPYLEDLIVSAGEHIEALRSYEMINGEKIGLDHIDHLKSLWKIFVQLSYAGRARAGKAGCVGISKAVLLLTDGRVGPAFDSKVRTKLGVGAIDNIDGWIHGLEIARKDVAAFERSSGFTLREATPDEFTHLRTGRIYDMALGPG